jgi:anaerobic selenocysteine-containing dehydrogenase
VRNPGALVPTREWRAQAEPLPPAWQAGSPTRIRGLLRTAMGMPTAAAADEILLEGPGQVRALFVIGGNPVAAWTDQLRTIEAMRSLELLVCVELFPTATTEFAHYVFAGKHPLEVPGTTQLMEEAGVSYPTMVNWPMPYAMYTPAVVEPPTGADVVDEGDLFHQLATRMGITLKLRGRALDMAEPIEIDAVIEASAEHSRVPLVEVKRHPHGYTATSSTVVGPPAEGNDARLEVGFEPMLAQLAQLARSDGTDPAYPYRLISRRMPDVCNSAMRNVGPADRLTYNPAYLHPDELSELGLAPGDQVRISSRRSSILAIAQPDHDLRRGLVSCAHGWGGTPEHDDRLRTDGTNVGRLISNDTQFDAFSGIPLMSAIPVRLTMVDV